MTEQDKQDIADIAEADLTPTILSAFPTDTASGSIASFSDGADNLPLKSLVININPIQDLHGQDSPYPAGGGKNKFDADFSDKTMNGTVITKLSDGKVSTSGAPTSPFNFVIGTVTLSAGDYILNGCPVGGGLSKYKLQVTDFPVRNDLGQDSGSGVSFTLSEEMTVALRIQVYTGAPASLTYAPMIRLASITDATYSPYENICPISGWTQVNVNHSDADMTNPTTLTISLGQIVYGGKLDVLSGELTVDRAMVDLGTLNWTLDGIRFKANVNGMPNKAGRTIQMACSMFKSLINGEPYDVTVDNVCYGAYRSVYVHDFSYTDATTFTTAMSGVQLCYELAEPIEIQLSANQINSLLGVNNIWADSGDTEAEYRADTKLYIAKKIAEALASLT